MLLLGIATLNGFSSPCFAQSAQRRDMLAAANANVTSFTQVAEVDLVEQLARLNLDWQLAFQQLNARIAEVAHVEAQLNQELETLISESDPQSVNLATLVEWDYRLDTAKNGARNLHETTEMLPEIWRAQCTPERLGPMVVRAVSAAMHVISPFRVGGAPVREVPAISLMIGIPTEGGLPSFRPSAESNGLTDQERAYIAAGTVGSGTAIGAAIGYGAGISHSAAAATAGTTIGAGIGFGVGAAVAALVISIFDQFSALAAFREFDRNSTDAEQIVSSFRDNAQIRLSANAVGLCQEWSGSLESGLTEQVLLRLSESTSRIEAQVESLRSRRTQLQSTLLARLSEFLTQTEARFLRWQIAYTARLDRFLDQLLQNETPTFKFIRREIGPTLANLIAIQSSDPAHYSAADELLTQTRLWNQLIDGDIAFRVGSGWSFPNQPRELEGASTGWSLWIESLRRRASP